MIAGLRRKIRQVIEDPALRRYLWERMLRRQAGPSPFLAGFPPYLNSLELTLPSTIPTFKRLEAAPPSQTLDLTLPGAGITLHPDRPQALFEQSYVDIETELAAHRFAWAPVAHHMVGPAWFDHLWSSWVGMYGNRRFGWPWHPYTTAERAINVIELCRTWGGLPGIPEQTAWLLAEHAKQIISNLEYYGDHYTGNHLSNNGRGLYYIGCFLEWDECAKIGAQILLREAERIITDRGFLKEDSSHYQLLVTRNYVGAWLMAARYGRDEERDLAAIARRMLQASAVFRMPGGFPCFGDISPDCPPSYLWGLLEDVDLGWVEHVSSEERKMVAALSAPAPQAFVADGWARTALHEWTLMTHAAVDGWPAMPGHGHQDLSGFELHWRDVPVFVDPGRGAYGDEGDAAHYRSATVHGGLQIDGRDPTPANRPYYDNSFRKRIGGAPPSLEGKPDGLVLTYDGFRTQGAGPNIRDWRISPEAVSIFDTVNGTGRHEISRRLVTPWPVRLESGDAVIELPAATARVRMDGPISLHPVTRWRGYGQGETATAISVTTRASLPWSGAIHVEIG